MVDVAPMADSDKKGNGVVAAAPEKKQMVVGETLEHGLKRVSITPPKPEFIPSEGLTTSEAEALTLKYGKNELEEKSTPKWLIFLKLLYQPMPIMIWIAIVIELAIQNWIDAGILLGIQFVNAFIGWYETTKAGDAVAALKASLKPQATVKRDGKWQTIESVLLVPGDLVMLGSGSAVPADCIVNGGRIEIDQSALTGESLPVTARKGDAALMGSTVVRGETEATVENTGKNTFFGRTATMLQGVDGLGHLQKILLIIMSVLVVVSLLLCIITLIYLMTHGESFSEALQYTVVLLVASIPIAIEIVCTTTLALGSRELSDQGGIVTRLACIEEMAGMNMLCSDKTGTLTLNKMVIQPDCPVYQDGETLQSVLQMAALAAKWHEPARDALDRLVLGEADLPALDAYKQLDYVPFDPATKRTEATLQGPDGKTFKTTKGAPHVILNLCANKAEVEADVNAKVLTLGLRGIRSLAVARSNDDDEWLMLGILTFLDPPRPDTKRTVERAMEYGVDVKMITGDQVVIAKETARQLGLGDNISDATGLPGLAADGKVPKDLGIKYGKLILEADGFAQVYPEHKYIIVEALRQAGFAVGMTGDGVNDAPALKRADVGIAVQGSTDAARAAADIVLTQPGLSIVVDAMIIARCIFQRMKSFITYRIAATLQLVTFFFIAVLALHPASFNPTPVEGEEPWPEFFRMPVLMLMLITLLNDGTLISIGYDHVNPNPWPERWNLKVLFLVSTVLAGVALGSSVLLLWAALDSVNPDGLLQKMGLPALAYGQVVTMIYLKVSVSDFLTLFCARCHGFFWTQRPALILVAAAGTALALSTALATAWPPGQLDGEPVEGLSRGEYKLWPLWVWLYCLVWWFIQDGAKVLTWHLTYRFNIFNINAASLVNMRAAEKFTDPGHPLARQSAGMVEGKLLKIKAQGTEKRVQQLANESGDEKLARSSQELRLARKSVEAAMQRRLQGQEQPEDLKGPSGQVQDSVEAMRRAAERAPASHRAEIQQEASSLQRLSVRIQKISDAVASEEARKGATTSGSKV